MSVVYLIMHAFIIRRSLLHRMHVQYLIPRLQQYTLIPIRYQFLTLFPLSKTHLQNDQAFFHSIVQPDSVVVLTTKLYNSHPGSIIRAHYSSLNHSVVPLTPDIKFAKNVSNIFILGLESEWTEDLASDRKCLNILRKSSIFA